MVTVPITLDQAVGYSSYYFGSGCQLLFPIILDQAVDYCFPSFWIRLLVTVPIFWIRLLVDVPITLDQAVGYCSYYFGSGC
jgi:hypothetical protein